MVTEKVNLWISPTVNIKGRYLESIEIGVVGRAAGRNQF